MRKKMLSLALALALCLGLTVPAMAAGYTEVIPCKYERVGDFSEGLAAVMLNGKWGFIDKTGKEVIPCQYENADYTTNTAKNPHFSEGLALMRLNDKWGFIDKTGKVVVPFQYDFADDGFSEGLAAVAVKNGQSTPTKYGTVYERDYFFIDKTGKKVASLPGRTVMPLSEGLSAIQVGTYLDWKSGYIDNTGKIVIPCQYKGAEPFSEGLAAVKDADSENWGFIDQTGKEVIPCQYACVWAFSDGLAGVQVERFGKVGFIDKTGKMVIPAQYTSNGNGIEYSFSDGLAATDGEKKAYIDKTGKAVIPAPYNVVRSFSEGLAVVGRAGKYGYIDKTGKEVVPCQYAWASSVSEGLAAVAVEGEKSGSNNFKWGFISLGGASAPQPEQPAASGPQVSNWAKEQVNKAAENGLVPDSLGSDYRVSITRAQFAATAVKLYEAMSGQKAPAAGESPFTDTSDTAVIQAEALGIVSGVGGGKFAPDALVTREQAAAMLSRVYTKLDGNIPEVSATTFADNDKVSGWARDAVAFMADKGIVSGVGNNQFGPQGNASIEQALVIALRMFDNLK